MLNCARIANAKHVKAACCMTLTAPCTICQHTRIMSVIAWRACSGELMEPEITIMTKVECATKACLEAALAAAYQAGLSGLSYGQAAVAAGTAAGDAYC